ncbi:MAG: RNase adapter RapZ [Proteobacteria bacterium]|nr:RNase adapter RapZ [Pseudomonadota bacterium]
MRLVIVSGLSGSGKSVALNMLEDLGWYCIDNIPAGLLNAFISHAVRSPQPLYERSAVGLDARNNPDEIASIPQTVRELRRSGIECEIIYLQAEQSMLLRRYGETRRRHPLVRDGVDLRGAIAEELKLLEPITYSADLVIDTSHSSVHELREMIRARVEQRRSRRLSIMFQSFGFKNGIPSGADFVFDARTLPNPYWVPTLQPLNGRDAAVIAFLETEPAVRSLLEDITTFIERRIPLYLEHNRGYLTVAVGCTGGQHRSVYLVERLAAHFAARYPGVVARHDSLATNA